MFVILMFTAILALACIASAVLIFNTEDVSVARMVGDGMAGPENLAS